MWNQALLQAGCIVAGLSCLAVGTLPKHRCLAKPTRAIPHGCFGSIKFSNNVVFLPFVLNGNTELQLRPVETLDLLSLRAAISLASPSFEVLDS